MFHISRWAVLFCYSNGAAWLQVHCHAGLFLETMIAPISPMHVLLLECHEEVYRRVKQALEEGDGQAAYHVFWAQDGNAARDLLTRENIGVCLVGRAPDVSSGVRWIQAC